VAYYDKTPYVVNGSTLYDNTPVYSQFTYRALTLSTRLGLRFYFPLFHEKQWFFGFGTGFHPLLFPTFTTTNGPVATPHYNDLGYTSFVLLPVTYLGLGMQSQRIMVSTDIALEGRGFVGRLGLGYRLGSNPDAPTTGPKSK
jgi:hypothetical protein